MITDRLCWLQNFNAALPGALKISLYSCHSSEQKERQKQSAFSCPEVPSLVLDGRRLGFNTPLFAPGLIRRRSGYVKVLRSAHTDAVTWSKVLTSSLLCG